MDFSSTSTLCFAESTEAFKNKDITIRECFQNHLAHVAGERHQSDDSDGDLTWLVTRDPVAGAFKMWILKSDIRLVRQEGQK
jgi:hypothetical protein